MDGSQKMSSLGKKDSYPKYPEKFHWRKRFLIPEPYLYKMRVVKGLTRQEIADWHHKELGVKISTRLVSYYLAKFDIRQTKVVAKKKKLKIFPFKHKNAVFYLNRCLQWRRYPFRYLDKLNQHCRYRVIGSFFRMSSELDHISKKQKSILWAVFKRYEVSPGSADLLFPNRNVMIDWGKVDALRADAGISISHFCEKVEVDKRNYQRLVPRGFVRAKRKSIIRISHVLPCAQSKFSKEIKYDTRG